MLAFFQNFKIIIVIIFTAGSSPPNHEVHTNEAAENMSNMQMVTKQETSGNGSASPVTSSGKFLIFFFSYYVLHNDV